MGNFLNSRESSLPPLDELEEDYYGVFVGQHSNWDCGLACCGMAAKWLQRHDVYERLLLDDMSLLETPLWTIDIYCFLRGHGVNARMQTLCMGIEPSHYEISWYQKHIHIDVARVNSKFDLASQSGWDIEKSMTPIDTVKEFLQNGATAIVLVDNTTLQNGKAEYFNQSSTSTLDVNTYTVSSSTDNLTTSHYSGHFIFLVKYDEVSEDFLYLDPAKGPGLRFVSPTVLERSRAVTGTDYDIIFCFPPS